MEEGWERERERERAYEESPVERLAALALDGVVGRTALSGVGATAGLALRRRSRSPIPISVRRRFLKEANHKSGISIRHQTPKKIKIKI